MVVALVAQRDGEVRGVGDDHGRARHVLHHAPHRHLALHLADAAAQLRVALALLVLVLDLLLAHPQVALVLRALEREVDRGQHRDRHQRGEHAAHGDRACVLQRRPELDQVHRDDALELPVGHRDDRGQDQRDLQHRQQRAHDGPLAEQPADALDRVDPRRIDRQRLGRDLEPDLPETQGQHEREDRQHEDREVGEHPVPELVRELGRAIDVHSAGTQDC